MIRKSRVYSKYFMKKAAAAAGVMMLVSLTACGGTKDSETTADTQGTVTESTQVTPTVEGTEKSQVTATVTPPLEEEKNTELYTTLYVANCQESITLRTAPSTSASEICQIPLGAPVSYIETSDNGFYKVIYNGKTGYALASYTSTEPVDVNPDYVVVNPNHDTYVTMYVVNCRESITLRTSPSTSASEICQIPLLAPVSYVEDAGNGFYKIIYNGKTGYALASYLDTCYDLFEPYPMTVVNCNESITLRTYPSTSADEICQIPLGATVYFQGPSDNGFYQVEYRGCIGYALASYLY